MLDLIKRKLRPDRAAQPPTISPPSNGHRTQDLPFDPAFDPMLTLLHSRPVSAYLAPSSTGGGNLTASGAIQMPYSIPTPAQEEFRHACCSWMRQGFDWPAWARTERGKRLMDGEEGSVESASKEEVGALVTAMLRSDRICEGAFAGYCERGMAGRVLRRVEQLWEADKGRYDDLAGEKGEQGGEVAKACEAAEVSKR